MATVSARVPADLLDDLETYLEEEKLDRSVAIRRLLAQGLERWQREQALEALGEGRISFAKAAEIAGMDVWTFAEHLEEQEISWVSEEGVREDLEAA